MSHEIRVLDGFNRFKKSEDMTANAKMFNRFGVGAEAGTDTMQGFNRILQGYTKGTNEDLRDWEFLVNIEHPEVMNGFEHFVAQGQDPMNGKKRQERREKREQKKQEKKQEKAAQPRAQRKEKRQTRRDEAQGRRTQKKNIRVAKKEERLQKKVSKREEREKDKEARRQRKDQRIADRKENRLDRQETRRERIEQLSDSLRNIGSGVGATLLSNLVGGEGAFQDMTFSDIPPSMLPGDFEDFITTLQDAPAEDVLQTRDQYVDDAAGAAKPYDKPQGGGSSMMMPLLIGGGALLMLGGKKKKRKK